MSFCESRKFLKTKSYSLVCINKKNIYKNLLSFCESRKFLKTKLYSLVSINKKNICKNLFFWLRYGLYQYYCQAQQYLVPLGDIGMCRVCFQQGLSHLVCLCSQSFRLISYNIPLCCHWLTAVKSKLFKQFSIHIVIFCTVSPIMSVCVTLPSFRRRRKIVTYNLLKYLQQSLKCSRPIHNPRTDSKLLWVESGDCRDDGEGGGWHARSFRCDKEPFRLRKVGGREGWSPTGTLDARVHNTMSRRWCAPGVRRPTAARRDGGPWHGCCRTAMEREVLHIRNFGLCCSGSLIWDICASPWGGIQERCRLISPWPWPVGEAS